MLRKSVLTFKICRNILHRFTSGLSEDIRRRWRLFWLAGVDHIKLQGLHKYYMCVLPGSRKAFGTAAGPIRLDMAIEDRAITCQNSENTSSIVGPATCTIPRAKTCAYLPCPH